jgi:predicted  nucleic acid-binding Zn-ribbon protein
VTDHLRYGCKQCGHLKRNKIDFFAKAKEVHGDKYDYSLVEYKTIHDKVTIVCPIHGQFSQKACNHLNKQGCPQCGLINRGNPNKKSSETYVAECKAKYHDQYDYSKTQYVNKHTKITYTCFKHGKITQNPTQHKKHGCPYCNGRGVNKHTKDTFVAIANKLHDSAYDYSLTQFNKITDYIWIVCPKHGRFHQRANNHIHLLNGCPHCNNNTSKDEKSILTFVQSVYGGTIIENDKKKLKGKEIDIYLPEINLGIEYNGLYYHAETISGKKCHWEKANLADQHGIQLIQINENEWFDKQDIVKSKIRCLLGQSTRIYARKCEIKTLKPYEKNVFLDQTHIQGKDGSSFGYGLFFNDELVSCMTFGKSRFNKRYRTELIRYSSKQDVVVVGGADRLLKHYLKNNEKSIISYADRRWSRGKLYEVLGFRLDGITQPSFSYVHINKKEVYNRMNFQKKNLKNMEHYSDSLTEYEIMGKNGYDRIWDAGQRRYVLEE